MLKKIQYEEILKEFEKLDEHSFPLDGTYTLFILPDGKMVGENKLVRHQDILEKILKIKIESLDEFFDIMTKTKCVKIKINEFKRLYVNINTLCTKRQKVTLGKLGACKYEIQIDQLLPNAPNRDYCMSLFKP